MHVAHRHEQVRLDVLDLARIAVPERDAEEGVVDEVFGSRPVRADELQSPRHELAVACDEQVVDAFSSGPSLQDCHREWPSIL